jgi:hypothetical protein
MSWVKRVAFGYWLAAAVITIGLAVYYLRNYGTELPFLWVWAGALFTLLGLGLFFGRSRS